MVRFGEKMNKIFFGHDDDHHDDGDDHDDHHDDHDHDKNENCPITPVLGLKYTQLDGGKYVAVADWALGVPFSGSRGVPEMPKSRNRKIWGPKSKKKKKFCVSRTAPNVDWN